jgi:hypothetical protein
MDKELQLFEAAEEVLAGFKSIIGMTAQAQLEEVKPYDLIAESLVRMGIDLDDRRIASHLSPSAQLLEKLTQKASTLILPPEGGRGPRARIFVSGCQPIELPLPSALADMEKAWWEGYLPDLISSQLAVEGGLKLDPYWDAPTPVRDGDRW